MNKSLKGFVNWLVTGKVRNGGGAKWKDEVSFRLLALVLCITYFLHSIQERFPRNHGPKPETSGPAGPRGIFPSWQSASSRTTRGVMLSRF